MPVLPDGCARRSLRVENDTAVTIENFRNADDGTTRGEKCIKLSGRSTRREEAHAHRFPESIAAGQSEDNARVVEHGRTVAAFVHTL